MAELLNRRSTRVDLGFYATHLIVMSIYPMLAGCEGGPELTLYQQLLDRLNTAPGVEAASFSRFCLLRRGRASGLVVHGDRDVVDPEVLFVVEVCLTAGVTALTRTLQLPGNHR